jgi:hypothetical protein
MPIVSDHRQVWPGRWETASVFCLLFLLAILFAQVYLPFLPNEAGRIAGDYSLFLPDLLAGYYWFLHNGVFSVPWFSPAQCGGVPYFPDPQVAFYALPQILAFWFSPLVALQANFVVFAAAGFLGTYGLARVSFRTTMPAALLAASLFMFNNFYTSRILVGHLTFHAFMLLPLFAASLLPSPGEEHLGFMSKILRIGVASGCFAYMMQSGMFHILPPTLLSFLIIVGFYTHRFGWRQFPFVGLAASLAVGLLLSGGKLAASLAFVSNFPRNDYPLPGIASLWVDIWLAFRTLFFAVPDDAPHAVVNTMWAEAQHEWEYGVSAVPLCFMLALAAVRVVWRRTPQRVTISSVLLLGGLIILLAIPIAVNWFEPGWNAFLKSLPFFGSSSNLLRWFSAYILPAILGGALALDALCAMNRPGSSGRATLAAVGIAMLLVLVVTRDLSYYGAAGAGTYEVATIQAAYAKAAATGIVPAVDSVVVLMDQSGHVLVNPQRDDTMTRGHSQLLCYQPIFGYRLEHFPVGGLHPGPALDRSNGVLNFKNPACYVFPKQNGCVPGDQFEISAEADARTLLDYRRYSFQVPFYARAANWISVLAFLGWIGATLIAVVSLAWPEHRVRETA